MFQKNNMWVVPTTRDELAKILEGHGCEVESRAAIHGAQFALNYAAHVYEENKIWIDDAKELARSRGGKLISAAESQKGKFVLVELNESRFTEWVTWSYFDNEKPNFQHGHYTREAVEAYADFAERIQ